MSLCGLRVTGATLAAILAMAGTGDAAEQIAWPQTLHLVPGAPLVALPAAAGAIVAVDETLKDETFTQTITLAGDPGVMGENGVVIRVVHTDLAPKIDDNDVAAEVRRLVPDMDLRLGPPGLRNTFGLYGAVMGSRGNLSCVYAWQRVNLADRWLTGVPANPLDKPSAMTLRYRLCRTGVGTAALMGAVQAAQSVAATGDDAAPRAVFGHGDPLMAAASLEAGGAPAALPYVLPVVPERAAPKPRRRAPRARQAAPPVSPAADVDLPVPAATASSAPAVPLP